MLFKQFYLGCLAHASYMIGSDGEAAIVDPQRDVDEYIAEAERAGLKIRYVIETHLHADFVSGHRELADRTGAEIIVGAAANAAFPHRAVRDGDTVKIGSLTLRAMETPGHTPEGISWIVAEEGRPNKILTGDTLFIGDVGRPDLAGGKGYTSQQMAAMLYETLHKKILALPDETEVWPAHGAGSACGKNISRERSSTIGVQRRTNYALQPMSREQFVEMLTADLPEAPAYFPHDAEMNRLGARSLSEIRATRLAAEQLAGSVVLDARESDLYGAAHIPGAINVGLNGQFASWCGTLLPRDRELTVIVDDDRRGPEATIRLARVGLENVRGYLPWEDWNGERATIPQITVEELVASRLPVLDVRGPVEVAGGRIDGSQVIPLAQLQSRISEIERRPLAAICGGGYRSSAATSVLEGAGFRDLHNVIGGMAAWRGAGYPVVT